MKKSLALLMKLLVAAFVAGGIYAAVQMLEKEETVQAPVEEVIRPVRTMVLERAGDLNERHYFGTVQGSQRVDLSFRVAGPLRELPLDRGAQAKKGQLVARLDPRDFQVRLNNATSYLAQTQAQLTEAESNFKRYEALYEQKVIAALQYDQYKTALDVARSNVQSAQAQVKAARDALEDTELRAPFDGVIADRFVENYQDVQAKQPILSLQNLALVEIVFDVPDRDMTQIARMDEYDVKMTASFESIPGRIFDVTFKEFAAQADPRTQTYPVRVVMAQPGDVRVLPGMPVTVSVSALSKQPRSEQAFYVPAEAILGDAGGLSWVWKVVDGKAQKVQVHLGSYSGSRVEIQGDLKPSDLLVTAGVHYLNEGQKVRLLDEGSSLNQ